MSQKVHKKDLDILSGATMVVMRRILTKSSHFKKLFVNFSLHFYDIFFPKHVWPRSTPICEFSPTSSRLFRHLLFRVLYASCAYCRPIAAARLRIPPGPTICEIFATSSGLSYATQFSRKLDHGFRPRTSVLFNGQKNGFFI